MRSLRKKPLNGRMDTVVSICVRILEAIFIVGLLGSGVVLILTLIEDAKSLLPGGDKKESDAKASARTSPSSSQFHASDPVA